MPDSDETPATTERRQDSRFYRRPLGLAWLIGAVAIPLLLAVIGYGAFDRSRLEANAPTGSLPTLTESGRPGGPPNPSKASGLSLAPASIVRNGNDVTLSGDFPNQAAKDSLLDAVVVGVGSDANVIDNLTVNPDVTALDFSGSEPVFKAAATIPDFTLSVIGDTITLAGTAASTDQDDAVEQAAVKAWPNLNIVDNMEVKGPVTATPGSVTATPGSVTTSDPGAPAAACTNLQSNIDAVLPKPITFPTGGFALTPAMKQTLTRVADTLNACPGANVVIKGYADNTGNDAVNTLLSDNRADAVADFLVAHGVTRDHLTAQGFGSADPIVSNDTPDGRAQNRRVEIAAS